MAKRNRIMKRSMKLGHCICDPKRVCPCDVFKGQGICPCAGERPEPAEITEVKLTRLVHNAGCASKISAADLERFLARLPEVRDDCIVSGLPSGDDAAVYRISPETAIVQTVDVFTPCVDDPYKFGKICAANCLSDVYAMGGVPRTALSVLAFPIETMDGSIMCEMMKGAMEVLALAHCSLLGGHSIKDSEIKLGFAITGTIDPGKSVSLETARIGDILVLTKPLGVGVLSFARQIGRGDSEGLMEAEISMMTLNKEASEAMIETGVSACTDVTGFGLFGHLIRMARHSNVTMRVIADSLPVFSGVLEALREQIIPGAIERNSEFAGDDLSTEEGVEEAVRHLGFDAQTSGGLLISVPESRYPDLIRALKDRNIKPATIGRVTGSSDGRIELVRTDTSPTIAATEESLEQELPVQMPETQAHTGCCADVFSASSNVSNSADKGDSTALESDQSFTALMNSVARDGAIDARTKQLIAFSLVVHARCEPCIEVHYDKAKKMGITNQELEEAAWCAVSMGGAPVRMFFSDFMRR